MVLARFLVVFLLFVSPLSSPVLAGVSGLIFEGTTTFAGDTGASTNVCTSKPEVYQCDSCSTETVTCPTGYQGFQGRITAVPYGQYGTLTADCPNPVTNTNCALSSAQSRFQSACVGNAACTYISSNAWFGSDPCRNTGKIAAAIVTCSNFQRSNAFSVFRASLTTPAYWSTGNNVWGSSATGPDEGLTRLVTIPPIRTNNIDLQPSYTQTWTFSNGRMYVLVAEESRIHEFTIPTSLRTLDSSSRTAITDGTNPLIAAIHAPRSGTEDGGIYAASADGGIGLWTKSGNTWGKSAQYSIPSCSGAPCYRIQTGAAALSSTHALFGASLGRVVRLPRSSTSNTFADSDVISAAAGLVTSLAVGVLDSREYLYVGSSLGLVFQYDLVTNRINSLALLTNSQVGTSLVALGVHIDAATGALFATATDGTRSIVSRIKLDTDIIEQIDSELLPEPGGFSNSAPSAIIGHAPSNNVFVGTDQPQPSSGSWSEPTRIHRLRVADCSTYDCNTCGVTDRNYCGYCGASDSCVLVSSISPGSCAQETTVSRCPTFTSISKTSGSSAGFTSVVFSGNNLNLQVGASNYTCRFGSVNITATSISPAGVTCLSPPAGATPLNTPFPVSLFYRGRLLPTIGEVQFSYISCGDLTCSSCFASGDCTWCYKTGTCSGVAACPGTQSTTQCPTITSLAPTALSTRNRGNVTVQLNDAPVSENYRCDFGGGQESTGTPLGTGRVSCPLPPGVPAGLTVPSILIESDTPGAYIPFSRSASRSTVLDVYDCDTIDACYTCVDNHPDCGWCITSPTTAGGCSYNNTVEFTSTNLCSVLSFGSCPRITSTNPSSIHYIADNTTTVDVALQGLSAGTQVSSLACTWLFSNRTVIASLPASAGTTIILAKCPVPNIFLPVGSVLLQVDSAGVALTNGFSVTVYDCSAGTSCFDCTDSVRPKCQWCNTLLVCEAPAALVGCTITGGCPSIVASPASDSSQGGSVITITPTPDPNTESASCRFVGSPSIDITVGATRSGANYLCTTPRFGGAGTLRLQFQVSGTLYAAPIDFEVYDCAFTPTALARTCSDCVGRPGCSWCGSSCSATSVCTGPLQTCPKVTAVAPLVIDSTLPTFVTVTANVNPPPTFNYDCVFGTQRTPATVVTNGIRCLTPNVVTATPEGQPINVQIGIRDVASGAWSTNQAGETQTATFFRCSTSGASCGGQCASTYCGFCADQGRCTGREACIINNPEAIWLNGTSVESCPALESFQPEFMQVAIRNRTIIPETVSFRIRSLTLPSPVNVTRTGKRDILLSDFTCAFGADSVPVDSYDPQTNTFRCTAPVLYNQGFYSVHIAYKGSRLNPDDNRFQVQDCFRLPACSICLLQPNCGWCRGSVRCMTKAWCDQEPIKEWGPVCPSLLGVSPATGSKDGGYQVSLGGGPFVDSPSLYAIIRFPSGVNVTVNVTRTSEAALSITIPKSEGDYDGEVKIAVFIDSVEYVPSTVSFTYLAPAGIVQGVAPGAIAGIVVAFVVVIAALIIALLVMKTRKVGFFSEFKLTPPDYNLVAYGTLLQPQYKMPKDNYEILAIKLLAKDHGFVFSVMGFTAATEQDPVARALTHFYEWHKKSVEYGVLFVSDEVKRNKSENTIFRNNSMASKWFKFYSKIVGVEYLFNQLSRFIYELNKISEVRSEAKQDGQSSVGGKSLLSLEMEVDPNKYGDSAFTDSEANVYQLILACQKVFTVIRSTIKEIPVEFKIVFQGMQAAIMNKFNSEDAILKAVGGFFYLRFVCPAITAPHAYGLLQNPPNAVAQRQLVLIGKVIQNLANMTMPGAKEEFMQQLSDFFTRNIPKMKDFYVTILKEETDSQEETSVVSQNDVVRQNALAYLWSHIHTNEKKLRAQFTLEADGDDGYANELNAVLDELKENYPKAPKKLAEGEKKGKADD